MNKLEKAHWHAAESRRLFDEAHKERKLPDVWRIGQKVRTLAQKDWAWNKGDLMYVVELRDEYKGSPAAEYQVFYTGPKNRKGYPIFWTTPNDVELVDDA